MSGETVGHFFIDDDGQVWKQIGYASEPTATLVCIDGRKKGKRTLLVVSSMNASLMKRLVPDE